MSTLLLFADLAPEQVRACLEQAFDDWVAFRAKQGKRGVARELQPLREESEQMYRDMWAAFVDYCAHRGLGLADLSVEDLNIFLTVRGTGAEGQAPHVTTKQDNLSPRYARRYLVLIDRITRFVAKEAGGVANTAARELLERPEYKYANADDKDPVPEYLTAVQAKRLIAHVTQRPPMGPGDKAVPWKWVRDRTAVAVMLGAGLSPGDVRALRLDGVVVDGGRRAGVPWKLSLPGNGNADARETPVSDWAGRQLAFWLTVRQQVGIPGKMVFPSTASGTAWSHTRCFESCRDVLESAGLGNRAHGLFRLRHTFALRQLSQGKDEKSVAQWLGLKDLKNMERYSKILMSPVEVV